MKRKFTLLAAALMLLSCLAVPLGMWGQTVTFVAGTDTSSETSITKDGITISFSSGTFSRSDNYRCYSGAKMSVSSSVGTITEVILTCTGSGTSDYGPGKFSGTDYSYSGTTGTWSNPGNGNLTASAQVRMTQIEVTYTPATPSYTITAESNNTEYGTVSLSGSVITGSPKTGYRYASPAYTVTSGTATVSQSGNEFTVTPSTDCTVRINFEVIPTYTVTLGDDNSTLTEVSAGAGVTLPTRSAIDEYTFAGWSETNVSTETTTAPTIIPAGTYYPTSNITLYPVYSRTESGSGTTDVPVSTTIAAYASANSWVSGERYTSITLDEAVTISGKNNGNNSKYYSTSPGTWRHYAGDSGEITVSTSSGTLKNVTITYSGNTLTYGGSNVTSGTAINVSGTSAVFAVSGSSNNTQVSAIGVTYTISGSSTTYYWSSPVAAAVAKPTFSVASGIVDGGTVVTISCATDGATIYYSTNNGTTWTEGNSYTVNANVTLQAKATKGDDESGVAEATYSAQYVLTVTPVDQVEFDLYKYHDETLDELSVDAEGHVSVVAGTNVRIGVTSVENCYDLQRFNVTYGPNTIVPEYLSEDEKYSFTMPASNATLSAQVAAVTYTIQYSVNGAVVAGLTENVNCGNDATLPTTGITVPEGYTFSGWSTSESSTTVVPSYTPEADATLYAVFASNVVTTKTYSFTISISDFNKTSYAANDGDHTSTATATTGETMTVTWTTSNVMLSNDSKKIQWRKSPAGSLSATNLGTIISVDIDETSSNALTLSSSGGSFSITDNGSNTGYALSVEVVFEKSTTPYYTLVKDVTGTETMASIEACHLITVKNGGTLTLTGANNGTAANLIIEDGGQLITGVWVNATVKKNITAYTSADDGWNLISSPVNTDLTAAGIGLTTETTYDLYYLNEGTSTWINYKGSINPNFSIQPSKGYLYSNAANTPLSFSGYLQPYLEDGYEVNLTKAGEGWNLVGNPFPFNAYVNKPYYVINGRTVEVYEGTDPVSTCTGIIVKATAANEKVTFRRTAFTDGAVNNGNLQMTLAQQATNRGTATNVDNAIVSFNEGSQLEKFYFGTQNANLYIPQGTEEYAIVSTEAQGEMPVSFRANENGQYTLTVNAENVEMNYLHLIDNMTGADIDLLQTPSYTFNAKTTDYESRFRLVFAANNSPAENGNETFAYYNGSEWIISNMGEATLQVVDVMGRVLSTETVNGNATINLNQTPGVYMFRLINGDSVRTQKIVVR